MKVLTKKHQRILEVALNRLFTPKSFVALTSLKDLTVKDFFARQLRLADHSTLMFTDTGIDHMRQIVDTIDEADIFDGLASYSDIWSGCHQLIESSLSDKMRPDNGAEFLFLLRKKLSTEISNHIYAVPVYGLKMEGVDLLHLGSMEIVVSLHAKLEAAGIKYDHVDLPKVLEASRNYLWLIGSANGTPRVSLEKFREQAVLAVGMLAIHASATYDRGASAFRIGVIMSPEEGHERAAWFSWKDFRGAGLTEHRKFIKSQPFVVDHSVFEEFTSNPIHTRVFEIFKSDKKTELEEAITKAIYWYSDAHRDTVLPMKLIKYWSCVETFFSLDKKDVTRSVSVGLASVLVYGGYSFVAETDYVSCKKKIAKLYDLRSRAVHRASYNHVSERDVAELSQWVAWMIINMISLVERGYTQLKQILEKAYQLDQEYVGQ